MHTHIEHTTCRRTKNAALSGKKRSCRGRASRRSTRRRRPPPQKKKYAFCRPLRDCCFSTSHAFIRTKYANHHTARCLSQRRLAEFCRFFCFCKRCTLFLYSQLLAHKVERRARGGGALGQQAGGVQVLGAVELAQVAVAAVAQHSHDRVARAEPPRRLDGADAVDGGRAADKEAVAPACDKRSSVARGGCGRDVWVFLFSASRGHVSVLASAEERARCEMHTSQTQPTSAGARPSRPPRGR